PNVQQAAIRALAPLLGEHVDLHQSIQARLTDNSPNVQQAAISALAPLLGAHTDLRQTISGFLANDANWQVRRAAISALAPLLPDHPDLHQSIQARLTDDDADVREAAIKALAPLLADHANLQQLLLDCLTDTDTDVRAAAAQAIAGIVTIESKYANMLFDILSQVQDSRPLINEQKGAEVLATNLGLLAVSSKEWRAYVIEQLSDFDWRRRAAAAQVLAAAGKEAVEEALPQLLQSLEDYRGPEAWRSHIATAELVINDDAFCDRAIELLVSKLDYGVDFVFPLRYAEEMRKEAALALGKLKAVDRREDVAQRIAAVLASGRERNPKVLDALFSALSSLVAAPETEQQTI
ncbi:MAG: HEAT repeat domain-containing protein, partial [Chloroflexota bacterium]